MAIILPAICSNKLLLPVLSAIDIKKPSLVEFTFPQGATIYPGGLALLTAWILNAKALGCGVKVEGVSSTIAQLDRMNFFEIIGEKGAVHKHVPTAGRLITLKKLDRNDVHDRTNEICDLVLKRIDGSEEFLATVEWITNELLDNIVVHAEAIAPGIVCAQYFPNKDVLEIAIVDMGRGIRASLGESHQLVDDSDAIEKALEPGISRDLTSCGGNGLSGTAELTRLTKGELFIWTGEAELLQSPTIYRVRKSPHIDGTGVVVRLKTCKEIDFSDARIISENQLLTWSYLDSVATHADSVGGFEVRKECVSFDDEDDALGLARKVTSVIGRMESNQIVLDFANVAVPSNVFITTLINRLIAFMSADSFETRIRVRNFPEPSRSHLQKVIFRAIVSKILLEHSKTVSGTVYSGNEQVMSVSQNSTYQTIREGNADFALTIMDDWTEFDHQPNSDRSPLFITLFSDCCETLKSTGLKWLFNFLSHCEEGVSVENNMEKDSHRYYFPWSDTNRKCFEDAQGSLSTSGFNLHNYALADAGSKYAHVAVLRLSASRVLYCYAGCITNTPLKNLVTSILRDLCTLALHDKFAQFKLGDDTVSSRVEEFENTCSRLKISVI